MRHRSNVSPVPLPVERDESDILVEYLDGRRVRYRGPVEAREGAVSATLSQEVHVLVVDPERPEGIMTYVNDYDTSDDILASTGVGRVLLGVEDSEEIYPGVTVSRGGETLDIDVDGDLVDGAVYAFVENDLGERAYRLSAPR